MESAVPFVVRPALVSNQFEEVLGSHHYDAIQGLDGDDWVTFYVMAALGSTPENLATDWILSRLVEQSPASREALCDSPAQGREAVCAVKAIRSRIIDARQRL